MAATAAAAGRSLVRNVAGVYATICIFSRISRAFITALNSLVSRTRKGRVIAATRRPKKGCPSIAFFVCFASSLQTNGKTHLS